jgi:hypothetical protein
LKPIPLTHDTTMDGFAIWNGPFKLAVITTRQEGPGIAENVGGVAVLRRNMVNMPRSSWRIHFTSPSMSVEMLEAIARAMPPDDEQTHPTEKEAG